MKIRYIKEDGLNQLKDNIEIIYNDIISNGTYTVSNILSEDLILDSPFNVEDFELNTAYPKGSEALTDVENIQRVYNHMRALSDSQASDERIWVALAFTVFLDYMKYRYKPTNAKDVQNRFFFNYSPQRSLFRNGISRLWWLGRLTYDEKRSDPYELTKFICRDQDYIESIFGRNVFNNFNIQRATITALFTAEKNGIKINRNLVRDISKYMNLLAGTYMVDILEYQEIYDKVYKKLQEEGGKENDL